MPRALGLALCRGPAPAGLEPDEEAGSDEEYATLHDVTHADEEGTRRASAKRRHGPAVLVTTVVVLGIRRLRA
eukprot:7102735-Heterocapsa_arctica.AAC.1